MPNIREFTTPALDLRPTEVGVEATAAAARRGGAFYNQAAQALTTTGERAGSTLRDAGLAALQYETHQQISQGAPVYAQLNDNLTKNWDDIAKNVDPNNTSVAGEFREKTLEPALERFRKGFTTEASQQWAESRIDALRNHFFEKTTADMSSRAKEAVSVNVNQTMNGLTNTAMRDPSAVPHLLESVDGLVGGMVGSSPNLRGSDAGRVRIELSEKMRESIVKAGALGAIQRADDPEKVADQWAEKYPQYISGSELKMLSANARTQIRAARQDQAYADHIAKQHNQDVSDAVEGDYLKKLESDDPQQRAQLTTKTIVNDERLTLQSRKNLRTLVERELKPETETRISARTSAEIFRAMRNPDADPNKIRDMLYDARGKNPGEAGSITKADFNDGMKNLIDLKTPDGQDRSHERDVFLKRFAPTIDPSMSDPSNESYGHHTALGLQKMYELEKFLQNEEKRLGVNWRNLYTPGNAEYFGDKIGKFRASMQEAAGYQREIGAKNLTAAKVTGVDIVNIPAGMSPTDAIKWIKDKNITSGTKIRLPDGREGVAP